MSKCLSCLHYEVCDYRINEEDITVAECTQFTARSEWAHLPCKVGDKVYIVKSLTSDGKNLYIVEDVAKRIVFNKSEDTGFIHSRIEFFNTASVSDWLFQNIFHTREEAEKALEEKKWTITMVCR